jgi:processive 1,2-diacylglycerol beta-glucosyltransferase
MTGRRFLLMHVTTTGSGHYRASRAIEQTVAELDPHATVLNVNAFEYASRFVRWAISRTYLSLIRHQPDVWEYLYDNPVVHRRVQYFRALLHRYQAAKLDVIVCTQAYPCGMAADFKKHHNLRVPIVGVLTDYAPHLYWFHDTVDMYVVPSVHVKRRFITRGVDASRLRVLGIPIDSQFMHSTDRVATARQLGLDPRQPVLLIMGGGTGFGQIREMVESLDILPFPCQMVVLTGTNRRLLAWLQSHRFRHKMVPLSYTEAVAPLMDLATLLVSKPGGMTTSEALAKHLPLVIVNPIPGQEAYNARYLLAQGAAAQASSPDTVRQTVRDLLENPERLDSMRRRASELAQPTAALDIARLMCELADRAVPPAQPALEGARRAPAGALR